MNTNTMKLSLLLLMLTGVLLSNASYAVRMSTEEFKEYAREDAYWVVSVDCEDGSESRTIQKKTDGDQWCSKDIDGYCYDTKVVAADRVCGNSFALALIQKQENQAAQEKLEQQKQEEQQKRDQEEEQARQRQLAIEAELLEIEQEKLGLRRQELELQKRAVEIRDQLKALEAG